MPANSSGLAILRVAYTACWRGPKVELVAYFYLGADIESHAGAQHAEQEAGLNGHSLRGQGHGLLTLLEGKNWSATLLCHCAR